MVAVRLLVEARRGWMVLVIVDNGMEQQTVPLGQDLVFLQLEFLAHGG